MSTQVCSAPGQTEGKRKAFLKWKNMDLSYINYYKSVHHPIPTRVVRIGNILAIFKINQ